MSRLNKLLTGHDITDEVINRTGSTALALGHDTMLASSVVVRTAAGGGGTLLTLTTDYTLGSEDIRLTTEAGATVYTTLAVVNGAYQNMNLYVTYKTVGDYASVESVASVASPVGSMTMFAAATAPDGWLLCQGQAISRTTYARLYAVIGATWGVGNGSTTFNLPDMRESSPYGSGTYSAVTGTTHGAITAHDALGVGEFVDDQLQGHKQSTKGASGRYPTVDTCQAGSGAAANSAASGPSGVSGTFVFTDAFFTDGTNGTPRIGTTTRGKIIGVNFIIKY